MRKRIVKLVASLTFALAVAAPGYHAHAASGKLTCSVTPALVAPFSLSTAQYQKILAAPAGTTETINGVLVVKESGLNETPVVLKVNGTTDVVLTCN
jgi:hypothetical protein